MENIDYLLKLGVDFDRESVDKQLDKCAEQFDEAKAYEKSNLKLQYTREAAHSTNRIVHCKDRTGKEVEEVLAERVRQKKNIKILEHCFLVDLIKDGNRCLGGVAIIDGKQVNIFSRLAILATGGIGGIFKNSTNIRSITGDGISIAIRNNIKVKNLNYIQFHPTAFFGGGYNERRFLISEAVRGEGGLLLNSRGDRFVNELLPRDVVTAHIQDEKKKTNFDHVYLDVTFMKKDFLTGRFPTIYSACLDKGIDISKERIPVSPAQHYFMGGIEVDRNSRTSMEGLYACGEASCTGVHGANRLASNSLLEGLVFSRRAALDINRRIDKAKISLSNENMVITLDKDSEYYENNQKRILIDEIIKVRGDIKNELVKC